MYIVCKNYVRSSETFQALNPIDTIFIAFKSYIDMIKP
jgi:hypothetical protein